MQLTEEQATSIIFDDYVNIEVISEEIVGTSRWSLYYFVVFRDLKTDKIYGIDYSRGATEYQDQGPEFYEDPIKPYPVKEVMKVSYERV